LAFGLAAVGAVTGFAVTGLAFAMGLGFVAGSGFAADSIGFVVAGPDFVAGFSAGFAFRAVVVPGGGLAPAAARRFGFAGSLSRSPCPARLPRARP
jgi:hypothetical protein